MERASGWERLATVTAPVRQPPTSVDPLCLILLSLSIENQLTRPCFYATFVDG